MVSLADYARDYASYYERISPDNLGELKAMLSDDVVFVDPFNKLVGADVMVSVFAKMFDTMTDPHFEILDISLSSERAYLKWRMTGIVKSAPQMDFDILGMSELVFDADGKVVLHHDHWDSSSQLLSKLPYIGWLTRRISRLFAH